MAAVVRRLLRLAALAIPLAILGVAVSLPEGALGIGGQSALFFTGVLVVALLGGIASALLSAVLSGLLLLYFLVTPLYTLTTDDPDGTITIVVLLLVAAAVAALVDRVANRAAEARRSSQEAELLALFADSVLRDADLNTLLERIREAYSQRAVSMLTVCSDDRTGEFVASVGKNPCTSVNSADTAIHVGDDEFWMLLAGKTLTTRDRRVLSAVAGQAVNMLKQRTGT